MTKSADIDRSGFPLQIGLAREIDNLRPEWRVIYQEHGWRNERTGESGFIDLVAEYQAHTIVLNIECKRPQNATWQFLLPKPHDQQRRHCKLWASYGSSAGLKYFDWLDTTIDPASYESEFCVIAGQDSKSRPMLERTAAMVVDSTEALANEEAGLLSTRAHSGLLRVYINIIATTAKLEVCKFDPNDINLEDGTVGSSTYETVPYIRFRKQLSAHPVVPKFDGIDDGIGTIARAKENTVLVVGATELTGLLDKLELSPRIAAEMGIA